MDKNSNSAVMHSVMADIIERWTQGRNQTDTAIPGLVFHRWDTPTEPTSYTLNPNICMIAQGAKRVMLGEEVYVYDAASYLVSSMELPVVAQIIEASEEKPYLGLTLELDLKEISQLMADIDLPEPSPEECRGIAVSKVTSPLLNAVQRLLELLDSPDDIPILAPLVQREIFYRLLLSEQGPRLRHIVSVGSHGNQIARAIDWLKDNYDKQFQVKEVADHVWMSSSSFHKHFRSVTAMTPLQLPQTCVRTHRV